jgi:predicted phage tail protein
MVTAPVGSTTNHTPAITWSTSAGASTYDLWVDNLTTRQSQVIRQQTLTAASFTPANPLAAGSYRVWVRAISSQGDASAWSSARDFTIVATPPPVPVVTAPSRSTTDHTPTITWSTSAGASRYDLWVDNLTTRQSQVIRQQTLTAASFTPTASLATGTYRVWVRAFNAGNDASAWSMAYDFTIV